MWIVLFSMDLILLIKYVKFNFLMFYGELGVTCLCNASSSQLNNIFVTQGTVIAISGERPMAVGTNVS